MKRFSLKSTALLALPCLIFPLAVWISSRVPPAKSGIEIQIAKRRAPTPRAASEGADVGVSFKFNENPNNNTAVTWKTSYRVDAGGHKLWDSKNGDGALKIQESTSQFDGAWNEWKGDFKLQSVPASWGDVVLSWDAQLTHGRTLDLPGKSFVLEPSVTHRSGKIVLRSAYETLNYRAKIDRNPHLKFVDWEITRIKLIKGNSTYRVRFFFQLDKPLNDSTGQNFNRSLELRGRRKGSPAERFMHSVSGIGNGDNYNFASIGAEKANRIASFTQEYGTHNLWGGVTRARVEAKISFQDAWPLKVSVPFVDAEGRVLLHRARVKMTGKWRGF